MELWEQVDVFLPSIYQFYNSTGNLKKMLENIEYVSHKMEESFRLKKKQKTNNRIIFFFKPIEINLKIDKIV